MINRVELNDSMPPINQYLTTGDDICYYNECARGIMINRVELNDSMPSINQYLTTGDDICYYNECARCPEVFTVYINICHYLNRLL
jgi:hypothetical protein